MTKYFYGYILLGAILIGINACQPPVEGCTNPRAVNFNAEADENVGCNYYQLVLEMQYRDNGGNVFNYGNTLTDADGSPFVVNSMPILTSQYHLLETTSGEEASSVERLDVITASSNRVNVEDNFAILKPDAATVPAAGWATLGTFDQLEFSVGIPDNIRNGNPSKVEEQGHPLSTSASSYMYDSMVAEYTTSFVNITLPNTGQNITFSLFGQNTVSLPYAARAEDGQDVQIRLQLNYEALFDGVSFTNDPEVIIKSKIEQNFANAFSVY